MYYSLIFKSFGTYSKKTENYFWEENVYKENIYIVQYIEIQDQYLIG